MASSETIDNSTPIRSISDVLRDLDKKLTGKTVSIDDILLALHERGFGFVLLIFAAPMALPIPVPPGINILLATPLLLLTAQQALGRHTIWMPEGIRKKTIERKKFKGITKAILPWLEKLEVLSRPRLGYVTQGIFSNMMGLLGLIMALTICIPLPLTNTIPSLGIALMAIGVIMRDGLAVLAGAITGTLWVCLLAGIIVFVGTEGIDMFKDTIKSFL